LICLNGGVTDSVGSLLADVLLEMKITPFILGEIKDVVSAAAVAAALQPAVVVGLPRQILQLAKYLPSLRPESVLLTADNIDTLLRLEIGRLWQTKVLAHWGMTETGFGGGVECPGCTGYHIRHADLLIQIIDPDTGALLPVGAEGEIVVSTLNRQAMPVIRYRTGDISRLLATPCVCGSTLLRLGPVFGHRQNGYRTLG
ncbi:MAG: phenylacetate--CoA ligase family protein, partial [Clostridiales bacterium]